MNDWPVIMSTHPYKYKTAANLRLTTASKRVLNLAYFAGVAYTATSM